MGSVLTRNRYWWYRSLYDDYTGREMRMAFGLCNILWLPHYYWGIHINRKIEEGSAHKNYEIEFGPRRNRLTHSLTFEEFEIVLENWMDLNEEYQARGQSMLKQTQNEQKGSPSRTVEHQESTIPAELVQASGV